ncbi:hypothetical protein BCAR13_80132 [Paraburkholderia caribensis]|nr:hypothetical protein BCAR13_80132 [Paraburkholderia caribensis]
MLIRPDPTSHSMPFWRAKAIDRRTSLRPAVAAIWYVSFAPAVGALDNYPAGRRVMRHPRGYDASLRIGLSDSATVDVEVEILLRNLVVRAVFSQAIDSAVDGVAERRVFLSNADAYAWAKDGEVLDFRALSKREVPSRRRLQEAGICLWSEGHGRVDTTCDEVRPNQVLRLVRDDVDTFVAPILPSIGLLSAALQYTDALALERLSRSHQRGALFDNQCLDGRVELACEVNHLESLLVLRHRGIDSVELARLQSRNHAVERVLDPDAFRVELGTDCITKVDVEPLQFAARRLGFKRRVRTIDTKTDLLDGVCCCCQRHAGNA